MKLTEAERTQLESETLLRYVVLKLSADGGALLCPRPEAPLLLVARTELWPHAGCEQVEAIWRYSRRSLLAGDPVRRGTLAVLPLFGGRSPKLEALLAFHGLPEGVPAVGDHTHLFDLLVREVTLAVATPPTWEELRAEVRAALPDGARNQIEEAMRASIEDALAQCRGNVTQTALRMRVPLRTLWGQIKRLKINTAGFRVRPA